jgi:DNA-directed RNA polymerase specialized sigma24 family protein
MSDSTATTRQTPDDQQAVTDGGGLVLRYGTPAESIGKPGKVFAQFDGNFVLLRRQVLNWGPVRDNEVEPGLVNLNDVPGSQLGRIRSASEPVELDELAATLAENSGLDERGATVLLLFEGFELDPPEIATELSVSEETVVTRIESIYDRYDEDEIVDAVQEQHPEVAEEVVRAFVLAEGFGRDSEGIANDLGVDEDTAVKRLDTAHGEHPELADTLETVI